MEKERKTERRTRRGKTDEESAPLGCVLRSAKSGAAAERKVAFERKRKCAVFSLFHSLTRCNLPSPPPPPPPPLPPLPSLRWKTRCWRKKPPFDRPSFPPDWISDGTVYIRAQRRFFLSLCTLRKHCAYVPCLHVCMSTMLFPRTIKITL